MNERTTYEQLIAKKLQDVPVPDMADAIWSRIEKQLDSDMPDTDSSNNSGKPSPSTGGGKGLLKGGLSYSAIVVAALVTVFVVSDKKNQMKSIRNISTPIIKRDSSNPAHKILPATDATLFDYRQQNVVTPKIDKQPVTDHVDSVDIRNTSRDMIRQPIQMDSIKGNTPGTFSPVRNGPSITIKDTVTAKKRPIGVKGISDNDYRIVPEVKDTIKH